ncbi:MAG TPA: hypothetical protein PKM41_07345 [Deltaproteobacteria bacterium]|jgi:hypothetical protein|nr:hypothetical protein [Deltaproteobacteria bacterium]HOI06973.1 hypothetical protein [Deltaproteobacteria bacterium]
MKAVAAAGLKVFVVTVAVVFMGVSSGGASGQDRVAMDMNVRLYPAPKQYSAYSLYYDITLVSPGLVSVGVEVTGMEPGNGEAGQLLSVSLVRNRNEIVLRQVDFGPGGGTFSYGIDAFELERGRGEYRIVVSNRSLKGTVDARLVVLYPGAREKGEEEGKVLMLPSGSI